MSSQGQYTTNKVVFAIGALNFEGNIIPHEWYQYLKTDAGTPHMTAIIILSEVLYWYRPTVVRDECTGKALGYRQKFKADKLQRSYESFVKQFGFTKGQVKSAIDYLVNEGYLSREFRNITVGDGLRLSNVMYLEPVVESVERITKPQPLELPDESIEVPQAQDTPPTTSKAKGDGVGKSTHGGYAGGGTNTEITTENSTNTNSDTNVSHARVAERTSFPEKSSTPEARRQNAVRKAVREHFELRTNLKLPTSGARKGIASQWWNPIREVCELSGYDLEKAKKLVDESLSRLEGLTVSDPHSIIKTARAVAALKNGNGARGFSPTKKRVIAFTDPDTGQRVQKEVVA
jgi:hypothetical protein